MTLSQRPCAVQYIIGSSHLYSLQIVKAFPVEDHTVHALPIPKPLSLPPRLPPPDV